MNEADVLTKSTDLASRTIYEAVLNSLDVRQSTLIDYSYRIKHFQAFIELHGISIDVLLRYKRSLDAQEGYGVSTKNKYLACARTFLRQCTTLRVVPFEFNTNVKFFVQSKKHKKFGITEGEAGKIYEWIDNHPERFRENVLLSLLLFQGLRQAEICNIKFEDVRLDEQRLFIRGKGHDDKEAVYLHRNTRRALRRYMASIDIITSDYLFSSKSRKSQSSRLTERGLRFIIKAILNELGIDKNVHGFRHFFTTHLIKQMPGNLLKVALFTRHRTIEMLQVYNDDVCSEEDVAIFDNAFHVVGI